MLLFFIRHGDPIYVPDSLTPQGVAVYESVSRRWQAQAAAWGAGLEARDLAAAARVLSHLAAEIAAQEE